ncbi:hypothetical protein CGJ94_26030, partial [Vibrio parahaemolyticus]
NTIILINNNPCVIIAVNRELSTKTHVGSNNAQITKLDSLLLLAVISRDLYKTEAKETKTIIPK